MHGQFILSTTYINAAQLFKEAEGSIQLLGGSGPHEGLVEMYLLGHWSAVCGSSYWDLTDASVVCRQLGYSGAVAAPRDSIFRGGNQRRSFVVDRIYCSGYERNITGCRKNIYSSEQCSMNFAGVICSSAS